ncbi:hypothetical protein P5V15_001917 [Pogonomyrmex californicus]
MGVRWLLIYDIYVPLRTVTSCLQRALSVLIARVAERLRLFRSKKKKKKKRESNDRSFMGKLLPRWLSQLDTVSLTKGLHCRNSHARCVASTGRDDFVESPTRNYYVI